jgi:hypothetical protein
MTHQDTRDQITCYSYPGDRKPIQHGQEQRYISPTTGLCRKLVVQSVNPSGPGEHAIEDHADGTSKVALWLCSTNPFRNGVGTFFKWTGKHPWFSFKLFWTVFLILVQIFYFVVLGLEDDMGEDSDLYRTDSYKPYRHPFWGQLWSARSSKEYSSRTGDGEEQNISTHSLYPRLLMIREPTRDEWSACIDPNTIIHTKFIAITYSAADMYTHGPNQESEKEEFIQEVRVAVVRQDFNAYWLDLECVSEDPNEKKQDLYCMADVYRGAEITLIMLSVRGLDGQGEAWKRWGERVWTFPEALLSQHLCYKFRDQTEIKSVSLHELANYAYVGHKSEQAIINSYGGRDPLERLERLALLKSAIWRRGITPPSQAQIPSISARLASSVLLSTERTTGTTGPHAADHVYALMGFFEHRIQPNENEDELRALARLSIANDSDRIAERMVSLLPTTISQTECWYADDDIYSANLWDIVPEIQVAGITEKGALVLDGCKAACIRWKDFPGVAFNHPKSVRRSLVGAFPYLAWPSIITGVGAWTNARTAGITLLVFGVVLLLISPRFVVYGESGRVVTPQPWLIGVKGVLDIEQAIIHLYGGGTKGKFRRLDFTPSGSAFAVPQQDAFRTGSEVQYNKAMEAEQQGPNAGRTYTLIDTCSATIYYFCADKPPTVCLFTGREGGLGRFVLCSERCLGTSAELHKETVLRMPMEVSQRMELCGWVALG